jgi:hypothetical protein
MNLFRSKILNSSPAVFSTDVQTGEVCMAKGDYRCAGGSIELFGGDCSKPLGSNLSSK